VAWPDAQAERRRGATHTTNRWEKDRLDIERIIDIDAPREEVWTMMTDVERWPEWMASVTSVALLAKVPLDVGSQS
jgi:uncharacterized membrane protein